MYFKISEFITYYDRKIVDLIEEDNFPNNILFSIYTSMGIYSACNVITILTVLIMI